jgi:hypothetical protein
MFALQTDADEGGLATVSRSLYVRCMRNPWNILRCKLLGSHRWETVRVGNAKGKECRDCKERVFDTPGSDGRAPDVSSLSNMGGISH